MIMNIFENNLKLLSKNNPKLAEKIRKHNEFSSNFALVESKSGDPNLKKNDYFLHDMFDPEQEAINFLNEIENKHSNSFNYIYGLGLGYLLKRFNKTLKGLIIVYEHDLDVLRLTFELVDFSDELSNPKVFIFDNLNDIETIYPQHFFYKYEISTSVSKVYKEHDFENAQNFINFVGYIHGIYDSNYKVYWRKHHSWVKSLTQNLKYIVKYDEVKALKNKFANKPAIVISAGPSLNKNIDFIAKYQNNFVIFCVGTALKTALKHGIKPDFICFVEFSPLSAKMIDEQDAINSNLILQVVTLTDIFERKSKNKFIFYADNDEASKWAAKKFGILQNEYINRGTVSVNALSSAKIMGCSPIVLTGQDLAYTNSQCYAEGSIYEDFKLKENKVDTDDLDAIIKKTNCDVNQIKKRLNSLTKQLYKVKGQNGEILWAPGDYASFIKYFEEIAKEFSNQTKLINATEGGAQINGFENMKFIDVVETYAQKPINKQIDFICTVEEKQTKIIENEIKNCLCVFDNYYKTIFDLGNKITLNMKINYLDSDNHIKFKCFLPELLKLYKKLRLLPKSDLLELLISRNIFFIDHYLKDFDDDKNCNCLINHLHCIFKYDYEGFVLPQIEFLRSSSLHKE